MLFAGCLKAPSTATQKGPEASCSDIDAAIANTQSGNVMNIQPGEFASTDTFTMVDGPYESLSQQEAVTVVARTQTASEIDLTIQDQLNENVNGTFKSSTTQGTDVIALSGSSSTQAVQNKRSEFISKLAWRRPIPLAPTYLRARDASVVGLNTFQTGMQVRAEDISQGSFCQAQAQGAVNTYNNLTTQASTMELPSPVQARSNCGGVPNCQNPINTQTLQFDRWVPDPNNPGQEMKVTTYIVTSSQVPFFASILSQCMQYSWPTSDLSTSVDPSEVGTFVLITTCSNVSDFTFGEAQQ